MSLTPNQRAVLEKLSTTETPLHGRDFAGIATVQNGRWEWANPILKGLLAKGLVDRGNVKTWKGFAWSITEAGRQALLEKLPEESPEAPTWPLSEAMKVELLWIGKSEALGEEVEAFGRRMTQEALARRGLVSITREDRGWRTLTLTREGRELYKNFSGKTAKS